VTSAEYARLKEIVSGALAQPDSNRSAYLAAQCGADATIRVEAESLLASALRAAPLYEDPTLLIAGDGVTLAAFAQLDDSFEGTARYVVRRRIGEGGMGIVYEVDDRERGQVVALKTLRRWSGDDIYRLKREFRNLADVAHPNLVSLYDLVIDDDACFFTMELVQGTTLVDYVHQESSAAGRSARARQALVQLIEGVLELHRLGIRHGDIKPSNVLVSAAGRVVLLDFGLATSIVRREFIDGQIAGTPAYLSPEQCFDANVSPASDWYSVGATLYHALTGRPPFRGTPREVIGQKVIVDPEPVSKVAPETADELGDVCMALLHRDPALRLSGREALARMSVVESKAADAGNAWSGSGFVGRADSLGVLRAALETARVGRSASVVVHGPSGIGKSALVQRFIETLGAESVLVLRSRCHEHESIPYKALDGVIDGLAGHLRTLPQAARFEIVPRGADALGRLFPVLRTVGVNEDLQEEADPIAVRHKAFTAFRELLGSLAERQPVVVEIDDFHWADADSITWLTELLRPPGPPALLIILSFRSEELESKPFLRSVAERVDIGARFSLSLAPLSPAEVDQVIESLLPGRVAVTSSQRAAIAQVSGGNPFLVDALARDAAIGGSDLEPTLDSMLSRRLDALPPESRAFLEVLAVCGRPMLPQRIFEACGHSGDERPLVARLRAAHLVRNSRSSDRLEMYHDRIRETLAARISSDAARQIHDVMARVLVAHGDDDPEALFEHYRAAGHLARAAMQAAAAADKASAVLAFDLAVAFYGEAIKLEPASAHSARWRADLARALENAGRPLEAADAYLEAAGRGVSGASIELQRKAAELLLIGGHIDEGLAVIGEVLRTVGVPLARGHASALASLALRRLQLRWRGLDVRTQREPRISDDDLFRIDACWSITVGLAMVDPIRAADFNVRQLLSALKVGDPYRIARAMALEGGFSVLIPVAATRSPEQLYHHAERLAGSEGQQYIGALTAVWAGIGAFLTGKWVEATERCGRAVTLLRDHCTGVTWELNLAQNFFLFSVVYRGELREAASHWRGLLQSARERGNFYLVLELSTRLSLLWLAADQPLEAEREADEAVSRWSQRGFERPRYLQLLTRIQTCLYVGRPREAWELVERHQGELGRPLFRRVQHTRIEIANWRARCALALAAHGEDARRLHAIALEQAQRIERERMSWSNPFAMLIRATVAYQQGDADAAVEGLAATVASFTSAEMHMHAAACRWRLGAVVGGGRRAALRLEADRFFAVQDVRNPTAFLRVIAPGFPD
jgi:eukaryotic-like serine/threonine-protein kinase